MRLAPGLGIPHRPEMDCPEAYLVDSNPCCTSKIDKALVTLKKFRTAPARIAGGPRWHEGPPESLAGDAVDTSLGFLSFKQMPRCPLPSHYLTLHEAKTPRSTVGSVPQRSSPNIIQASVARFIFWSTNGLKTVSKSSKA